MARVPQLTWDQVLRKISPRLKKFDAFSPMERYAMFMGKIQLLEFGLKRLLTDYCDYDYEDVDEKTLGWVIHKLRKNRLRGDYLYLLDSLLLYRNYFAHDFLVDQTLMNFILKRKERGYTKPLRQLSKAYLEVEQAIVVYDFLRKHNYFWEST